MRSRRATRRTAALVGLVIVCLLVADGVTVLMRIDAPVRTPLGAAGVGRGRFPVVEVAGVASTGSGFRRLTAALVRDGATVLDFDPVRPGIQPLTLTGVRAGDHVPEVAARTVQPAIGSALARAGFDPASQPIDVVAHSVGGLLVRFLVERPGGYVSPGWAARVDDLVMVGTPNHGSELGFREATLPPGRGPWDGLAADMRPGSALLRGLGTREPAGEVYTTIGGDPWFFRWIRGGRHGFDGAVPAESPFMTGAANHTFPDTHGRLLSDPAVVRLIVATLGASAGVPAAGPG